MIENRNSGSGNLEPLHSKAEAPWVEVRGQRILLVDDEESLRECLRMMLEMEGHQVTEATNGVEALDLFAGGHFDLVITDFEMPVMKGNTLALRLKQLAPSLPILMITASAKAHRDSENPVDVLLNKPFTMPELQGALKKLISASPEPAQPSVVPIIESPTVAFVPEATTCRPPAGVTVS